MTERAKNIDQVYRVCNPEHPLSAEDDRYVDLTESRGMKQLAQSVTRKIRRSEGDTQVKLLFTGHRGSVWKDHGAAAPEKGIGEQYFFHHLYGCGGMRQVRL